MIGFSESPKTFTWLGIPFAKPPLGPLRWRPPQPPEPWTGVRDALALGSACPQMANPLGDQPNAKKGTVIGREDCLYLNVYAPRSSADEAANRRLPVMLWIHGGGNSIGHAGGYDGSSLAGTYNVVVVTANYRLGALGFTNLADIGGEAWASSANCGILDQVAALSWVRENISAFGGDRDNVTIFGESAGGCSVVTLLATPSAKGLFHKAIAQSASTGQVRTREGADERAALLVGDLGVDAAQ
ncbi:MAG TPA: carboxylesterase family protein, partial [Myxococcota bacterium]|nr:carboxylesterase family protein [Myxococcota bacterium]